VKNRCLVAWLGAERKYNNAGKILIWQFGDDSPISPNLVYHQI